MRRGCLYKPGGLGRKKEQGYRVVTGAYRFQVYIMF